MLILDISRLDPPRTPYDYRRLLGSPVRDQISILYFQDFVRLVVPMLSTNLHVSMDP